jgi:hypothetical protein
MVVPDNTKIAKISLTFVITRKTLKLMLNGTSSQLVMEKALVMV